jgi:autotransporter-associated beta strand protein
MPVFNPRRDLGGKARSSRPRRRRCSLSQNGLLRLEALEDRLAPTASTWSGAASNLWSNNGNWDVPPASGNGLVFPTGAANLTNSNDLTAGTSFASLTFSGSGYSLGGNAIALAGNLDAQATGTDTVNLPISLAAATPTASADQSGTTLMLGGVLSGSNGLTTQGTGVVELSGANTYTGTTTVSAGTLLVDGTQAGSPVTVNSGATLGGSGTVGSITTNSATVSPGNTSPAILTDSGNLNLSAGSTFNAALNGTTAGSGYSQLVVNGTVTLNNATLSTSLGSGFTPSGNDQFTIIKNNGGSAVTGTFNGLAQGATVMIGGHPFSISYTGGTGNDVVLTSQVGSTTAVSATPTSAVHGQSVSLMATVTAASGSGATATPSGSVQFFSGTLSLGTATVGSNGVASLSTTALPLASNSITAQYSGDLNFTASTSPATTVTVAQASTTTALTASPSSANVGATISLSATVTATSPGTGTPTGTVQFFSGTTSLGTGTLDSSGVATLSTTSLTVGSNSITAKYDGDTNFVTSTSPAQVVTITQPTTTTLAASQPELVFGQPVIFTATVAPTSGSIMPTGTVAFLNGTTTLGTGTLNGSGVATFSTSALPVATNSITAMYSGNSTLGSSTSSATTVTVMQDSTSTVLTLSPNPSSVGQAVTLTATVTAASPGSGVPTGGVTFMSGTTTLGSANLNSSGVATTTTMNIPLGTNTITAQYAGDSNFFGSHTSGTQTVNQGTTTVSLTASVTNPVSSQLVQFTATVAPVSPATTTATGTVEFFSDGVSIGMGTLNSSGVATFSTTTLPLGAHSITAVYSGDSNYPSSSGSPLALTVGNSNELFLNQVYLVALHRAPDQAGLNYWENFLDLGYARKFVVAQIVHSRESQVTAVNSTYQSYLGRPATTGEVASALSPHSTAQGLNFNAQILGSREFYQNAGGTQQGFLTALGQAVLGTSLTTEQQATLTHLLDQGATRTQVSKALLQSNAGITSRVTSLYQAILDRAPDTKGLNYFSRFLKNGGTTEQVIIDMLASDELFSIAQSS